MVHGFSTGDPDGRILSFVIWEIFLSCCFSCKGRESLEWEEVHIAYYPLEYWNETRTEHLAFQFNTRTVVMWWGNWGETSVKKKWWGFLLALSLSLWARQLPSVWLTGWCWGPALSYHTTKSSFGPNLCQQSWLTWPADVVSLGRVPGCVWCREGTV